MVSKVAFSSNLFNHLLNLFQMLGTNLLFSWFSLKVWDSVLVALHSTFSFDMSQLNFNNFWTDWATEPGLDTKDASFRAVSEYDFSELRFYTYTLLKKEELRIRLFLIEVITEFACDVFRGFINDIIDDPMEWVWTDGWTNEQADVRMLSVRCLVTYEYTFSQLKKVH